MIRGIIALVFRAKITGGILTTSDESTAFRWVTDAEASQLASEAFGVRIYDALADHSRTPVRSHDGTRLV